MVNLKNLFLYGGLERENYLLIRDDITESNRASLRLYSAITAIGMGVLYLLSHLSSVLASSHNAYLVMLIVGIVLFFLTGKPAKKYPLSIRIGVYTLTTLLLLFGIVLGTVVEPNQASTSFGILIFAVPLLFTDVPVVVVSQVFFSIILYLIAAWNTQTIEMFRFNLSVVAPYGFASLILSTVNMRGNIMRHYLFHENKQLSERDQLTGMLNRRCYEQELERLKVQGCPAGTLFCVFDINGLKRVNDTLGHRAGDELIRAAADCINAIFGRYGTCYRTGGDEFFAVLTWSVPEEKALRWELEERCRAFQGVYVTELSLAMGMAAYKEGDSVYDTVNEADRTMYLHKKSYYEGHTPS